MSIGLIGFILLVLICTYTVMRAAKRKDSDEVDAQEENEDKTDVQDLLFPITDDELLN